MSHSEAEGLKIRKRRATTSRIAASAARLAAEQGLTGTTVDQIAADAEVARATFFRYYQAKENAVADGIAGPWLEVITEAIARQPARLGAMEAIIAAFTELTDALPIHYDQIRELADLTRTSTTLTAWTLRTYHRYEKAIAGLAADRIADLAGDDPRPRMIAAITMGAVRISLDDWIRQGGSLPDLIHRALTSVSVTPSENAAHEVRAD
ncbi:TetR family transcriptional regulator [Spirillospora sp. NPDC047279]|uniref:acyl-CoA-like ligand-binding transcription factor n=1 Tax=Spirillospora sp. NPDC047279 TaxID=3155478 RepID=UPI0033C27CE2